MVFLTTKLKSCAECTTMGFDQEITEAGAGAQAEARETRPEATITKAEGSPFKGDTRMRTKHVKCAKTVGMQTVPASARA